MRLRYQSWHDFHANLFFYNLLSFIRSIISRSFFISIRPLYSSALFFSFCMLQVRRALNMLELSVTWSTSSNCSFQTNFDRHFCC